MAKIVRQDSQACNLVLLGIALLSCVGAIRLTLGSLNNPGPGLFPFLLGTVLGIIFLILMIQNISQRSKSFEQQSPEPKRTGSKEIVYILFVLSVYGLVLEHLGFLLTSVLVFAFILRVVEKQRWMIAASLSILLSVGSYILFRYLLNVQLPCGILGVV